MKTEDDSDYKQALCKQADFCGMESLTETEQCIVNGWSYGKEKSKEENAETALGGKQGGLCG